MTVSWPIPSSCFGKTSETVGFFKCAPSQLADWLVGAFGEGWTLQSERTVDSELALRELDQQRKEVSTYLIVAAGNWSAIFTNGPLGTDVGLLPSRAARDLGVRAVRAVSTTAGTTSYETFIFEVFDPKSSDRNGFGEVSTPLTREGRGGLVHLVSRSTLRTSRPTSRDGNGTE